MIDGSRRVAILMAPMRNAAFIVLLVGLVGASAAAAVAARADDERLSINEGRGLVWIEAKGALIGRLDKGQLSVTDLTPFDLNDPLVYGCDEEWFRGPTNVCRGENIRFRVIGGRWRVAIRGAGIDLSAAARGRVLLDGDGIRTGVYSTDGVDCRTAAEDCEPLPEEETSFLLGTPPGR
jgi:hypothetical protein